MTAARSTHPFPARMAPELVSDYITALPPGLTVLDPMMGSGSFVLAAAQAGHKVIGVDSDPLAMVIASASAWHGDEKAVLETARRIAADRAAIEMGEVIVDTESQDFIDFWFDPAAQVALARLARGIAAAPPELHAPLWCGFSRLIITKDAGASRARDVSHSRPHVVRETASFDPAERFVQAVETVLSRRRSLTARERANLSLRTGDVRDLPLADASIDAVMTSPPYLTAIDYLRGHRMSLVWMGHSVSTLRDLRGTNIGSERGAPIADDLDGVRDEVVSGALAPARERIVNRYLADLDQMLREIARVLRPAGHLTLVVANSVHHGATVAVDDALALLGKRHGFREDSRIFRELPENRRYLPPPRAGVANLDRRMRTETILRLAVQ